MHGSPVLNQAYTRTPTTARSALSDSFPTSAEQFQPVAMGVTGDIKKAAWAFIALALVGWILGLIGLAGTQAECYRQHDWPGTGVGSGLTGDASRIVAMGVRGLSASYDCERRYSYYWFTLALEFVSLVGLLVLTVMGLLAASALSWMAWFTVLTLLTLQGSDTFLALRSATTGSHFSLAALTAAGWIIMAIANLALIFLLAWRPRKVTGSGAGGPIKY